MKAKTVVIDILSDEWKVIVCWGDSAYITKVLRKWQYDISQEEINEHLTDLSGVTFRGHRKHPVIALPRRPRTDEEIGVLAHEATHAVKQIFRDIKEDDGEEVFALSVGAVVRKTLSV